MVKSLAQNRPQHLSFVLLVINKGEPVSLPKVLAVVALLLFGSIGLAAWLKGGGKADSRPEKSKRTVAVAKATTPLEISLNEEVRVVKPELPATVETAPFNQVKASTEQPQPAIRQQRHLPEVDRIQGFFIRDAKQFPIVETIVYKSRVPWLQGRPAWLADYAAHYRTSRHFIARSLHGKNDYFKQDVAEGDRFNVLRPDKNIAFHLVVDIVRSKMWFYYLDLDANEKVLVKSYDVGVGRLDASTASGFLTPLGKYALGEHVGIYRPKSKGLYNGQQVEMLTIFGTRWIPFDAEIDNCTAPSRGLGIHGCPWVTNMATGNSEEDVSGIGYHTSDGCIRLKTADMEELFAIIISRPTTIELVRDFFDAQVPGKEGVAYAAP